MRCPPFDQIRDKFDHVGFEFGIDRQGQHGARCGFCLRKITGVIAQVQMRSLKMDRNWVVKPRLHAIFSKLVPQRVAAIAAHRIDVVDMASSFRLDRRRDVNASCAATGYSVPHARAARPSRRQDAVA